MHRRKHASAAARKQAGQLLISQAGAPVVDVCCGDIKELDLRRPALPLTLAASTWVVAHVGITCGTVQVYSGVAVKRHVAAALCCTPSAPPQPGSQCLTATLQYSHASAHDCSWERAGRHPTHPPHHTSTNTINQPTQSTSTLWVTHQPTWCKVALSPTEGQLVGCCSAQGAGQCTYEGVAGSHVLSRAARAPVGVGCAGGKQGVSARRQDTVPWKTAATAGEVWTLADAAGCCSTELVGPQPCWQLM
jgi:hypothetical protein